MQGNAMMFGRCRILACLLGMAFSCWTLVARAEQRPPDCAIDWVPWNSGIVTPAEVTGSPGERLILHPNHPAFPGPAAPDAGYLLTGDKVDETATCAGFAYVRYKGPERTLSGWVDRTRVRSTGSPGHLPSPRNAAELCQAAEGILNEGRGAKLPLVKLDELQPDEERRLLADRSGWLRGMARIGVNGRTIAAVNIETGGTCESSEVQLWNSDLSQRLSSSDSDTNPENNGAEHWDFGLNEDLVEVQGRPLIKTSYVGDSGFYLSTISRNGDIRPVCKGELKNLVGRRLESSEDDDVCRAFLAGLERPIEMQQPSHGESLRLSNPGGAIGPYSEAQKPVRVDSYTDGKTGREHVARISFQGALASEASFTLVQTGTADLDNSGHLRRVGIVYFEDGNSSAGCGTYHSSRVVPVFIDPHGVADPAAPENGFFSKLPYGMEEARLAEYAGRTYIELSPEKGGRASEVWRLDQSGLRRICSFQLKDYEVRPLSAALSHMH